MEDLYSQHLFEKLPDYKLFSLAIKREPNIAQLVATAKQVLRLLDQRPLWTSLYVLARFTAQHKKNLCYDPVASKQMVTLLQDYLDTCKLETLPKRSHIELKTIRLLAYDARQSLCADAAARPRSCGTVAGYVREIDRALRDISPAWHRWCPGRPLTIDLDARGGLTVAPVRAQDLFVAIPTVFYHTRHLLGRHRTSKHLCSLPSLDIFDPRLWSFSAWYQCRRLRGLSYLSHDVMRRREVNVLSKLAYDHCEELYVAQAGIFVAFGAAIATALPEGDPGRETIIETVANLGWCVREVGLLLPSWVPSAPEWTARNAGARPANPPATALAEGGENVTHAKERVGSGARDIAQHSIRELVDRGLTRSAVRAASRADCIDAETAEDLLFLIRRSLQVFPVLADAWERRRWQRFVRGFTASGEKLTASRAILIHEILGARIMLSALAAGNPEHVNSINRSALQRAVDDDGARLAVEALERIGPSLAFRSLGTVTTKTVDHLIQRHFKHYEARIRVLSVVTTERGVSVVGRFADEDAGWDHFIIPGATETEVVRALAIAHAFGWQEFGGAVRMLQQLVRQRVSSEEEAVWLITGDPVWQSAPWRRILGDNAIPCVTPSLSWATFRDGLSDEFSDERTAYLCERFMSESGRLALLCGRFGAADDGGCALLAALNTQEVSSPTCDSIDWMTLLGHGVKDSRTSVAVELGSGASKVVLREQDWPLLPTARGVVMHVCHGGVTGSHRLGDPTGFPAAAMNHGSRVVVAPLTAVSLTTALDMQERLWAGTGRLVGEVMSEIWREIPDAQSYALYGFPWEKVG